MSVPAEQLPLPMTLAELLRGFADAPAIPISGIASDSRQLSAGDVFFACSGQTSHGLEFINDAIDAKVAAIVYDASSATPPSTDFGVPLIAVADLGQQLGAISNRYYGSPSEHLRVIAVTGTNGKTSVAWFIAQCMEMLGEKCGYVGTLGSGVTAIARSDGLTTPSVIELHAELEKFRDVGATFAAIEVSSHALTQNRIDGVRIDTAIFTNLSRDHLDYHGDMQSYGAAKARLFLECGAKQCVVNVDSEFGADLALRCGKNVVAVTTSGDRAVDSDVYVRVRDVIADNNGSQISFDSSWGDGVIALPLPGNFNVENAMTTLALLLQQGVLIDKACALLSSVRAPLGRMQRVAYDAHVPAVYIDFAHTPAALQLVLQACRAHCEGVLWCVFGCGGDRDEGKRPQMGKVAEQHADRIVVTSDNPRSESPANIIAAIVDGFTSGDKLQIIEDRAAAIAWTISAARANDVILVAGKGHEQYQYTAGERRKFSDFGVAKASLAALAGTIE